MTHPLQGQTAQDFRISNQHGQLVSLSDYRGEEILLVFIPFAFSPVCSYELEQLRDAPDITGNPDVRVLVVSCDSKFVLAAWAEQNNYEGTLLSDFWPHGEVSTKYGVFDDKRGLARRGTFLINESGIVTEVLESPTGDARDLDAYREMLGLSL